MNIHSAPTKTEANAVPPSRHSQQRLVATDKRDAIMAAALALFVERGFYGTAVPEIAERAAVGAGTIYRYFESKEALVNELYRREKQRFVAHVMLDFPGGPARELFRSMWMKMAKFAGENVESFVFLELHHHARYLDTESRKLEQRMLDTFSMITVSAQQRGELRAGPPRLLMGIVLGAFIGVIRCCLENEQDVTTADWKLAEQCAWEAIRA
jgi:AcrR family transcriptional regulator